MLVWGTGMNVRDDDVSSAFRHMSLVSDNEHFSFLLRIFFPLDGKMEGRGIVFWPPCH